MFAKTLAFFSVLTLSAIAVPVLQRRAYTGEGTLHPTSPACPLITDIDAVTYFTPGLGACGITNTDTELVAAVSATFFDTYPYASPFILFEQCVDNFLSQRRRSEPQPEPAVQQACSR